MSKFWASKMKNYFDYLDLDKDGRVSKTDFEAFADCFFDEKVDPAVREKARALFVDVFRKLKSSDGSDDSGLLTAKIMIESLKQLKNDPKFIELYASTIQGFFKLMDIDGDGSIEAGEYARMFTTVGMNKLDFVKPAFASMDLDHDGRINLEEFTNAFVQYMITDDEKSPYKLLFGYLA